MKQAKGQSRLIDLNNSALSKKFYNIILKMFNLSIGLFTLREIIFRTKQSGFVISSVLGMKFPNDAGLEAYAVIQQNNITKRLFGDLLFDSQEERECYSIISERADEDFEITKATIDSTSSGIPYVTIGCESGSSKIDNLITIKIEKTTE